MSGAMVRLYPADSPHEWQIDGKTDESGTAVVYTAGYFKGVPTGEYKVTVDKTETYIPPLPEVLPADPKERARLEAQREAEIRDYRLVERTYSKVDSTPLSISVAKKGAKITVDVGKKYREFTD